MVNEKNIVSGEMGRASSVSDIKMMRNSFSKLPRKNTGGVEDGNEDFQKEDEEYGQWLLRKSSLSKRPASLETFTESRGVQGKSSYPVFIFEQLHNLYLRISKLVKKRTVSLSFSHRLKSGAVQRGGKKFVKLQERGC